MTTERFYAGIGSRKTPAPILDRMSDRAMKMYDMGFTLRSGAAPGADTAFEAGAEAVSGPRQIFVPWPGFENHDMRFPIPPKAFEIAAKVHPKWDACSEPVRKLMARNVMQIMGPDLRTNVEVVLFWAPGKAPLYSGGTSLALAVAGKLRIPRILIHP